MSSYLGVPPQSGFITTAKQRITSSTNNYVDLDHSISSLADVIVWVNFVKQDSTNLTLTTSSRITLGATLVASDIVEISFLGKAVATQNPSTNSVTNDMLVNSSITLNGSAVSLGGSATVGGDNTPSFSAYASANQSISTDTHTKINFDSEYWDTDSAYDTTNKRFVVPSGEGGKYAIASSIGWLQWNNTSGSLLQDKRIQIQIYINGSGVNVRGLLQTNNSSTQSGQNNLSVSTTGTIELSAGDYIEVFGTHTSGHNVDTYKQYSWFTGHKLIGV